MDGDGFSYYYKYVDVFFQACFFKHIRLCVYKNKKRCLRKMFRKIRKNEKGAVGVAMLVAILIAIVVAGTLLPTAVESVDDLWVDVKTDHAEEADIIAIWPIFIVIGIMLLIIGVVL